MQLCIDEIHQVERSVRGCADARKPLHHNGFQIRANVAKNAVLRMGIQDFATGIFYMLVLYTMVSSARNDNGKLATLKKQCMYTLTNEVPLESCVLSYNGISKAAARNLVATNPCDPFGSCPNNSRSWKSDINLDEILAFFLTYSTRFSQCNQHKNGNKNAQLYRMIHS